MRQDRFTEQSQEALAYSQELVRNYKHSQWDVEHILLALLKLPKGLTGEILRKLSVNTEEVSRRVEAALEKTPKIAHSGATVYTTPRTMRLLDNAAAEADRLKDEFIGTEHLLIAITADRDGEAAAILEDFGIDQEKLYSVLQELRGKQRITDPRAESK